MNSKRLLLFSRKYLRKQFIIYSNEHTNGNLLRLKYQELFELFLSYYFTNIILLFYVYFVFYANVLYKYLFNFLVILFVFFRIIDMANIYVRYSFTRKPT